MTYTPIIGTLAFVVDRAHDTVLLIHRNRHPDDEHFGKWNGLGGKLEKDENAARGVRREIEEESGLQVIDMQLRGTVSWPGFGANGEDWFCPIFLVTSWTGRCMSGNHEGDLHWIPVSQLLEACSDDDATRRKCGIELWEGDRHFIPLVFDDDPRLFHGVMPYSQGRPIGWTVERW